ncbi:MAG: glucose-6-phosphate isomerase [Gemmataceae bacterium]|nr:glucose-6-phosphate isomerase [Gemmataceae bacterium]
MELPDEAIDYHIGGLIAAPATDAFTPLAELQGKNFLTLSRLRGMLPLVNQVRGQIAAEREMSNPPAELRPLDAGFIDMPQKLLDQFRRQKEKSEVGRVIDLAGRLRAQTDRVVVLGIGGSYLGARALFDALCHTYHNELPPAARLGSPRMYFEGNNVDNDAVSHLLELLETSCVDPELPEERWGLIVVSKSGGTIETAVAYRLFRNEMRRLYGPGDRFKQLCIPVTGNPSKLRDLCVAEGIDPNDILPIPDNVGGRYSVFTPVGLLPAAVMGLDVRALLLGAAAMTKRFFEEPFEKNPVLQYAAVNHLLAEEYGKDIRVMAVWSKKLESVGLWYDQLLAESLGKIGRGPTPVTAVMTRDLHSRGQQFQEGQRDKVINNLIVKNVKTAPQQIGMADHNEDDLNQFSRRTMPDLLRAAVQGTNQAYSEAARPTADLVLPQLSEHTLGQLLQMLMLATVVEGRLMGVNPYGQPGVEAYKKNMKKILQSAGNQPA